ncbi:MAG TPA: DUF2336 domain-containing protein [Stellaceae bacterium]|nr:DUF2336 domain-containing protein [Stellaceae bacterium]
MTALTRDMVYRFAEEPSWTVRAKTIERIATRYAEEAIDADECAVAFDLFRLARFDAEPLVRRVLAEALKYTAALPRDIVRAIVADVAEVSAPFLACSPLLAEDDLAAIATAGSPAQRMAIARRARLPRRVRYLLQGRMDVA